MLMITNIVVGIFLHMKDHCRCKVGYSYGTCAVARSKVDMGKKRTKLMVAPQDRGGSSTVTLHNANTREG